MMIEQKIIAVSIHIGKDAEYLADELNKYAIEGWYVEQVSTVVTKKGGAIFVLRDAYYADTYYFTLKKSDSQVVYRCLMQQREKIMDNDINKLNTILDEQAKEDYNLKHIFHATCISVNEERPTQGTIAHILLFEKERKQ